MNAVHVLGDGGIYVFIRSWDDTNNILMTTSPGNNHCLLIKFVHKILQGEIKLPLDELVCSYSRPVAEPPLGRARAAALGPSKRSPEYIC